MPQPQTGNWLDEAEPVEMPIRLFGRQEDGTLVSVTLLMTTQAYQVTSRDSLSLGAQNMSMYQGR